MNNNVLKCIDGLPAALVLYTDDSKRENDVLGAYDGLELDITDGNTLGLDEDMFDCLVLGDNDMILNDDVLGASTAHKRV